MPGLIQISEPTFRCLEGAAPGTPHCAWWEWRGQIEVKVSVSGVEGGGGEEEEEGAPRTAPGGSVAGRSTVSVSAPRRGCSSS